MGGGPVAPAAPQPPHLLIALPMTEPRRLLALLRRAHPAWHITYLDLKTCKAVPAPLYASITALCTAGALPSDPQRDAPHLRFVHFLSAGVEGLLRHPVYLDSAITLTTSSGVHGPQMAEWALMTRLAHSHHLALWEHRQRRHCWDRADPRPVVDLVGQRVGVLGYGSIGRQVARTAAAAGMTVLAYTASPKSTPQLRRDLGFIVPGTGDADGSIPTEWYSGTDVQSLHRFLGANLDWLVVALPLTPKTRHLIGSKEFQVLARRKAFLTNLSRGPVLCQSDLIDALQKGLIQGAALDVTDPEPLPKDSPLWSMPNVTLTPHISGTSSAVTVRAFQILHKNLLSLQRHKPLTNVVDRRKGY